MSGTVTIERLGGTLHTVTVSPPRAGFLTPYKAKDYSQALGYAVGVANGLGLAIVDNAKISDLP